MVTHVKLTSRKNPKTPVYARNNITCCEFLKKTDFSTVYDTVYVAHPKEYGLTRDYNVLLKLINESQPYFTIKVIKPKNKKYGDALAALKESQGVRVVAPFMFEIKLNTEDHPGFVNLLTPVTLSRFVLTEGNVAVARPIIDKLIQYFKEGGTFHLPTLTMVVDGFHSYYKLSSEYTFATNNPKILGSAYKTGKAVGTVQSWLSKAADSNTWFKTQRLYNDFQNYIMQPYTTKCSTVMRIASHVNGSHEELLNKIDAVQIYEEVLNAHLEVEDKFKIYAETKDSDERIAELVNYRR